MIYKTKEKGSFVKFSANKTVINLFYYSNKLFTKINFTSKTKEEKCSPFAPFKTLALLCIRASHPLIP